MVHKWSNKNIRLVKSCENYSFFLKVEVRHLPHAPRALNTVSAVT